MAFAPPPAAPAGSSTIPLHSGFSEVAILHPEVLAWNLDRNTKLCSSSILPATHPPAALAAVAGSQKLVGLNLTAVSTISPEMLSWPVDLKMKADAQVGSSCTPAMAVPVINRRQQKRLSPLSFGQTLPLPGVNLKSSKDGDVLVFDDETTELLAAPFKWALVGKFSHRIPSSGSPGKFFDNFGLSGGVVIKWINHRQFLIILSNECDFVNVWIKRFYLIDKCPLRVFKWTPTFDSMFECPIVPVWASLPELPAHLFEKSVLFTIAGHLGLPLTVDLASAPKSKFSAKICIGLDLTKPVQTSVSLLINGVTLVQPVVFERLPAYCVSCRHVGHGSEDCVFMPCNPEVPKENIDEIIQLASVGVVSAGGATVMDSALGKSGCLTFEENNKKRKNFKRRVRKKASKKKVADSGILPRFSVDMHGDPHEVEDDCVADGVGEVVTDLTRVGVKLVALEVPPGGMDVAVEPSSVEDDVISTPPFSRVGFNATVGTNAFGDSRGSRVDFVFNAPAAFSCWSADSSANVGNILSGSAIFNSKSFVNMGLINYGLVKFKGAGPASNMCGQPGFKLITAGLGPTRLSKTSLDVFVSNSCGHAPAVGPIEDLAGPVTNKKNRKALAIKRRVRRKLKMKKFKEAFVDDLWLLLGVVRAKDKNPGPLFGTNAIISVVDPVKKNALLEELSKEIVFGTSDTVWPDTRFEIFLQGPPIPDFTGYKTTDYSAFKFDKFDRPNSPPVDATPIQTIYPEDDTDDNSDDSEEDDGDSLDESDESEEDAVLETQSCPDLDGYAGRNTRAKIRDDQLTIWQHNEVW